MRISAQISLYPLKQEKFSPAIEEAWKVMEEFCLQLKKGEMSTVVKGEAEKVFPALQAGFLRSAEYGPLSMVMILSNACPCDSQAR
jgi:uncharacterized protein YqgV (UPF0045/DUF77 family)